MAEHNVFVSDEFDNVLHVLARAEKITPGEVIRRSLTTYASIILGVKFKGYRIKVFDQEGNDVSKTCGFGHSIGQIGCD